VTAGYPNSGFKVSLLLTVTKPELPHGTFAYQKYPFGYILEDLSMKKCWHILRPFGIFYAHLYFCPFGIFYVFGIFSPFWYVTPKKYGIPAANIWMLATISAHFFSHRRHNRISADCLFIY
jgi:hypothetical protein